VCSFMSQVAEERLANMRTVRAFVQEEKEQSLYNSRIEHVRQLSYKEALAQGVFWASVSTYQHQVGSEKCRALIAQCAPSLCLSRIE